MSPYNSYRQAYETRSEFSRQRASLASINTRIVHVIGEPNRFLDLHVYTSV